VRPRSLMGMGMRRCYGTISAVPGEVHVSTDNRQVGASGCSPYVDVSANTRCMSLPCLPPYAPQRCVALGSVRGARDRHYWVVEAEAGVVRVGVRVHTCGMGGGG
jgi:hypothetical protein